ncbi:Glycoside hydrolase, family 25 like protein [Aduncisulcus paluster]|uniref:Glycoside hydrolase, family 25 like protein n=1 Tax=Aduncisulcus paluster TaxID=2918883 RepID=A0ABQ5KH84_9EUKA|nr:Glycoside hydrolase, family 25 like protein [Aduncisulcus paluster]|eukprot:gnl/Carplike_NY0171/2755_a3705_813.p1 GENE.gnl/Carplike_NY0171/2755_a3705_813~~gnl/Carplike_NY0171/2755_a3705_813.p1  ORF type:complete len:223 (+),score=26.87 gnl/Carplike_NY0171/2755_a3705_813:30-698(+)
MYPIYRILLPLVLFLICVIQSFAATGADIGFFEGQVDVDHFNCLKTNGLEFIILQALRSIGEFHEDVLVNFPNAKQVFTDVDLYIFPCPVQGMDPVTNAVQILLDNGYNDGNMIWIDVEQTGSCYYDDVSKNVDYFHEVMDYLSEVWTGCGLETCAGIYTSSSQWTPITGCSTEFSDYQLWWPRYTTISNPWSPFCGWENYNIWQYAGDYQLCGLDLDMNRY